VSESVIMADASIEAGARVEHSILDKYVRVGAGAHVGVGPPAEAAELEWLGGLALVGKDTWIPERGRVHRPSAMGVGGRYEDLENGVIAAGTVLPNRRWYEEIR